MIDRLTRPASRSTERAAGSEAEADADAGSTQAARTFNKLNSLGRQLLCGFVGGAQAGPQSGEPKVAPAKWQHRAWTSARVKHPSRAAESAVAAPRGSSCRPTLSCRQRRHSSQVESSAREFPECKSPRHLVKMIADHQRQARSREDVAAAFGGQRATIAAAGGASQRESDAAKTHQTRPADGSPLAASDAELEAHNSEFRRSIAASGEKLARSLGLKFERPEQVGGSQMERLIGLLGDSQRQSNCAPDSRFSLAPGGKFYLEKNWTDFVRLPEQPADAEANIGANANTSASALRLQQDAIWELLTTEQHYVKCLSVIVDTFLATLERLRQAGLLLDAEPRRLASNVEEIFCANCKFWTVSLLPMLAEARQSGRPMEPTQLREAFTEMRSIFAPYYRYCLEHSACLAYMKDLGARDELFRVYLAWCESQRQCERLRLCDLLAKPMQRLTRYALLLKAIEKRTERRDQSRVLDQMLAYTSRFVLTVDLELRRKDELELLVATAGRIEAHECCLAESYSDEVRDILRDYSQFDLLAPLFPNCPFECRRQLLFDSRGAATRPADQLGAQLKFKDPLSSSKQEIVLLIFTDCLLVCKQLGAGSSSPRHQSARDRGWAGASGRAPANSNHLSPRTGACLRARDFSSASLLSPRARSLILTKEEVEFARRKPNKSTSVNLADEEDDKLFGAARVCSLSAASSTRQLEPAPAAADPAHDHQAASDCSLQRRPSGSQADSWRSGPQQQQQPQSRPEQEAQQQAALGRLSQPALKAIRPPYPIERLVVHESRDGLAAVCCQLNDSLTVANFFVLYWPAALAQQHQHQQAEQVAARRQARGAQFLKAAAQFESSRSDSESVQLGEVSGDSRRSSDHQRSLSRPHDLARPASRLVSLVKQAQVRYQLAANFHKVRVVTLSSLLDERSRRGQPGPSAAADATSNRSDFSCQAWNPRSSRLKSSTGSFNKGPPANSRGTSETSSVGNCALATNHDSSDNAFSDTQLDGKRSSVSSVANKRSVSSDCHDADSANLQQRQQCQQHAKADPMLRAIVEQHQLMLMNHSQHDMLATHEYRYPILDRNYLHVRPVAISLAVSHSTSELGPQARGGDVHISEPNGSNLGASLRSVEPAGCSGQPESKHLLSPSSYRSLLHQSSQSSHSSASRKCWPQLEPDLSPQASVCGSSDAELPRRLAAAAAQLSAEAQRQLTNSSSSSARSSPVCHAPGRSSRPPLPAKPSASRSCAAALGLRDPLVAGHKPQGSGLGANEPAASRQLAVKQQCKISRKSSARRHLNVLRRQHVILSASSDQQQQFEAEHLVTRLNWSESQLDRDSSSAVLSSAVTLDGSSCGVSGENRRHLFSARHQNSPDRRVSQRPSASSELLEEKNGTLDDELAEMPTLSHALVPDPIPCCQCAADAIRAISFELGDLGGRKTLGIESFCARHSHAASDSCARSASMETSRSPVEVTLTEPESAPHAPEAGSPSEHNYGPAVEVCGGQTEGGARIQAREPSEAARGPDLFRGGSANSGRARRGERLASEDRRISVATSMSSLCSLSAMSNSAVFTESNLDQPDLCHSDTTPAPDFGGRLGQVLPRLNVTTASPQDLEQSYDFPNATDAGRRRSDRNTLALNEDSDSAELPGARFASHRTNRFAFGSMSAENLSRRGELGALKDISCITRLVREANGDCQLDSPAEFSRRCRDSNGCERGGQVYLGFHEKLERHKRRLEAEAAPLLQPPHSPGSEADERNNSPLDSPCRRQPSPGKWPFAQLRRRAQPLVSLFPSAASGSAGKRTGGGRQRAINLTRSMTSDLFESLLRVRPLRKTHEPVAQ